MVDNISAVLAAPVCSLFAATLQELTISYDQRVESFREEEDKSLQLLTSLQKLTFFYCRGLPSLPKGLHSLPSLTALVILCCPEIRSLPKGGLPTSLRKLSVAVECSPELQEEINKLHGTNPGFQVYQTFGAGGF